MDDTLAYSSAGRGEPLVLVHGLGSRRQIWDPLIDRLAERCEVFAVDLRGFGESPVGDSSAIDGQMDALAEFCARHGLDRPHVAGNSMGGALALELGRRGAARSVTAFSPVGFWHTPGRVWGQASLATTRRLAARLQPRMPTLLRSPVLRAAVLGLVFGRPTAIDPEIVLGDIAGLVAAPGFEQACASFTGYRFTDPGLLDEIPTTVAWGTRDVLLTYALQHRRARAQLPRALHVALCGCGHTPFYDDPQLCARTILETVERVRPVVDNVPITEG
jgi:pimeloyl-ACP methyl ester carboxylesterase